MRVLKNERLEKEVLLTISKNDVLRDVHSELFALSHQVKKHGFRSGKVPTKILFQERGSQAIDAAVHKHVLQAFSDIVGDRKLAAPLSYAIETDLYGASSIENLPDIDVRISAVFVPEISEISWKDIALDHYVPQPTEQEVDLDVADRAKKVMTSAPLREKRPAAIGDTLVYTMTYTHQDGTVKEVEGSFQLGSNALPKEFEDTLEGVSEGHVMSESLRVPKDFPDKSLAGKKVKFTIAFHEIRETVPHEVGEEFAQSQGFENLEALRGAVRTSLSQSGEIMSDMFMRNSLKAKLGKMQDFDVPESWVQKTLESLKRGYTQKTLNHSQDSGASSDSDADSMETSAPAPADDRGGSLGAIDADTEKTLHAKALAMVRADCIVRKIIGDNNFSVKDSELLAYARVMAQNEGKSLDDVVGFLRRNKSVVDRISHDIQERKALDWISAQCSKQEKEASMQQIKDAFVEESV